MSDAIYDIVAIARPFVDIIASVDEQFLSKRGIEDGAKLEVTPRELIAMRAELPRYDIQAGGSLSNTVAGMAALGASTAFLGKLCDDKAGQLFRNAFRQGHILFPNRDLRASPDDITGTCLVLVTPSGQGTVIYSRGVSDRLEREDLFPDVIRASRLVYVEGNLLTHQESAKVAEALEIAHAADAPIVLSLHAITNLNPTEFASRYVSQAEIVLGNEREFGLLYGSTDLSRFRNGSTYMVMTAGANGVMIAGRGENLHIPPYRLGSKPNTVGAGDQFAAGFLMGYIHGLSIERCAEFGGEKAAGVLEKAGARSAANELQLARKYIAGRAALPLRSLDMTKERSL
jgi:sugar/nucleoside kinase (ribokinase family)